MSDVAPEQAQPAADTATPYPDAGAGGGDAAASSGPPKFSVYVTTNPTGRTHGVSGGASFEPILGDDGQPEVEYVLVADLPAGPVPLQAFSFSALNQLAATEAARSQAAASG